MTLKTLKDLEWWTHPEANRSLSVEVYKLQRAVREWIQALKLSCGDDGEGYIKIPAQISILKHIFNLEE